MTGPVRAPTASGTGIPNLGCPSPPGGAHAPVDRDADPALMSAAQRMAGIGQLLARGYRRSRISPGNQLDERTPVERPCDPTVDNPETKDVA